MLSPFYLYQLLLLRIETARCLREVDHDVLHLGVVLQHHLVGLAAHAGSLIAAERSALGNLVIGVDPHTACLDTACHTDGTVDITGPDLSLIHILWHLAQFSHGGPYGRQRDFCCH